MTQTDTAGSDGSFWLMKWHIIQIVVTIASGEEIFLCARTQLTFDILARVILVLILLAVSSCHFVVTLDPPGTSNVCLIHMEEKEISCTHKESNAAKRHS